MEACDLRSEADVKKAETTNVQPSVLPGKPISLFGDTPEVQPGQTVAPATAPVAPRQPAEHELEPEHAYMPEAQQPSDEGGASSTYGQKVGGNGHGRNRVPLFTGDDRSIPAYIRRIDEN